MIDIVVVLRAEDAVLDFLSVLTDGESALVLADHGRTLAFPAGRSPAERLAEIARHVRPADDGAGSPGPGALAELVREAGGDRDARVWTHSPADNRRSRGKVGRDTAIGCAGGEVRHAVGYSPFLQVVSDIDRPLERELVATKLDFVNRACEHLLTEPAAEYVVQTPRIPATERFFHTDADERERLFALLASLDDEAASVPDPWEFGSSPYEKDRLDATAAWVLGHRGETGGSLVEVGACEGALTHRLVAAGRTVHATEPNPLFRTRLSEAVRGTESVRVSADDLAALTEEGSPRAGAHLLIEMLYYGQDLDLLDRLPTDHVFVALEPATMETLLRPWLAASATWREVESVRLVPPRVETVCAGRAYLIKRGSDGLLLRRTAG
ncbi:SAM-dependent methyltransferase [Streptomyces niveus]|uniref:SAM-dependent methyltransferase n=1 Tax=Streptomyces niveus TaxID=193462 RepID=UPI00365875F5